MRYTAEVTIIRPARDEDEDMEKRASWISKEGDSLPALKMWAGKTLKQTPNAVYARIEDVQHDSIVWER